jgi:hypothetical protein
MIAGYDPDAIIRLERNAQIALAALRGVTSPDPAASGAIDAVTRLRRALSGEMLPAVAAISSRNPLVQPFGFGEHDLTGSITRSGSNWTVTRWTVLSNSDLMDAVADMSPEERTQARPYGGLTQAQFDELVTEFTNRAARDPDFAQLMVDELGTPLLGDIVIAGTFSDDVLLGVLTGLLASAPSYGKEQIYRDEATVRLLDEILKQPDLALDALGDPYLIELILTVNLDRFSDLVPPDYFADLILTGMIIAPELHPERRSDAVRALANFVEVAQDYWFDDGFDPQVSRAISIIVGVYIDEFAGAADHDCVIDMVGDVDVALGTRDEVVEFFGSLVHDPTSRAILAAVLGDAAARAVDGEAPFSAVDVSALSVLINDAIDDENVELQAITDFTTGLVKFGFDIVDVVVGKVLKATGAGTLASFLIGFGVDKIEDAATDSIDTKTTGAPNFAQIGDILIKFEIIKHAVTNPDAQRTGTTLADIKAAQRLVGKAAAVFDDPNATYGDVQRTLSQLEADLSFILDADTIGERVNDAKFIPRETNDASDVCDTEFPT